MRNRSRYAVGVNAKIIERAGRKTSARRDFAVVVLVAVVAAVLCVWFDVSELVAAWTRPHERLQLDELPGVLLVLAVALVWFSWRRYVEARQQLNLRRAAEAELAEALAENQRLALKYVDSQESERKALARDLHDELGQFVNAIKLDAVAVRDSAASYAPIATIARAMIQNIDRVYDALGGLIRQLRPVGFDNLGLLAALEHCVDEWRSRLPQISIEMSSAGNLELDETRALVVFRLVQEALTNIARHSQATQARILIERTDAGRGVQVLIIDNGRGADLSVPRRGLGLIGMRERVAALGGSITLASAPGEGFKVMASIPSPGGDCE
jgi:two-component system, NarL family, sensor histidine kinase UhpB